MILMSNLLYEHRSVLCHNEIAAMIIRYSSSMIHFESQRYYYLTTNHNPT